MIAEKGVLGGEYTVGIIGRGDDMVALPIIKIEPATEFYDYEAKYIRDDTRYLLPLRPAGSQGTGNARRGALEAFRILGGRGWGRVDFLMDEDGNALLPRSEYRAGHDRPLAGADGGTRRRDGLPGAGAPRARTGCQRLRR